MELSRLRSKIEPGPDMLVIVEERPLLGIKGGLVDADVYGSSNSGSKIRLNVYRFSLGRAM